MPHVPSLFYKDLMTADRYKQVMGTLKAMIIICIIVQMLNRSTYLWSYIAIALTLVDLFVFIAQQQANLYAKKQNAKAQPQPRLDEW